MTRKIVASLFAALLFQGCGDSGDSSFQRHEVDKFLSLTKVRNDVTAGPLADTMFCYNVPIPEEGSGEFIYVVNPECSFCISNAIACYNAYLDSGSDIPFLFLAKSDNTLIFDYYLEQNSRGTPRSVVGEGFDFPEDGIYCLLGERVVSYSRWE
ncbi:MAG: hypothetical protein IJV54_01845 [Bacteroidales bacterium]|nr:hypothetical protein [Bacteroidales bacterium]MBQ9711018.1 hypothetical protein [Bacteroidales bacterium]